MPFSPSTAPVPAGFTHGPFHIRPTDPANNGPDYEAVMSSRPALRIWSDSPWPEEDFSLASNAEDLVMHAEEHAGRVAFGYNIHDAVGRVLGSVYINKLADSFDDYPISDATRAALAPYVGRVEFWMRTDAIDLQPAFFDALRAWLAEAWPWPVVFGARRDMEAARALYRSRGLVEVARLVSETGRIQGLYGEPQVR